MWHSRVDRSGRLPPVLGTSSDGTPIFAFLGGGRLATAASRRSAVAFYREFCNEHFGNDPLNENASPACIYRVCCNQPPNLDFEFVSATWDFTTIKTSLPRKLALGLGPKKVQEMYNKHQIGMKSLDIQFVEGLPKLKNKNNNNNNNNNNNINNKKNKNKTMLHDGSRHVADQHEDQDVFDFCETVQKHMKSSGQAAVRRLHKREKMAAIKIQCRYRARNGQLLAHMKKRILAEEQEEKKKLINAACRIQAAWRRKTGQMAAHLLRQAKLDVINDKKNAKIMYEIEMKAAKKISIWWSRVSGNFGRKMKERAEEQMRKEEEEMHMMARRIQAAWRKKKGGMAAHLKRQALREAEKEKKLEIVAAKKISIWWSRVSGNFGRKMKQRAEEQMMKEKEECDHATKKIQRWWCIKHGSFAAKMKARAEIQLRQEEQEKEEMNSAALKIQAAWRRRQGGLALHLKRQAKKMRAAEEYWVICWDEDANGVYFYDTSCGESRWDPPGKVMNSGRHTEEWYVCIDHYSGTEYYLCTTDFSVHRLENQYRELNANYYNPPLLAKIALRSEHEPIMEYIPHVFNQEERSSMTTSTIKRTRKADKQKKMKKKQGPEEVEDMPAPPPSCKKDVTKEKKKKKKMKKKKKHRKDKSRDEVGENGVMDDPFMPPSKSKRRKKKKQKF